VNETPKERKQHKTPTQHEINWLKRVTHIWDDENWIMIMMNDDEWSRQKRWQQIKKSKYKL